jgi:hypothetical protein
MHVVVLNIRLGGDEVRGRAVNTANCAKREKMSNTTVFIFGG